MTLRPNKDVQEYAPLCELILVTLMLCMSEQHIALVCLLYWYVGIIGA